MKTSEMRRRAEQCGVAAMESHDVLQLCDHIERLEAANKTLTHDERSLYESQILHLESALGKAGLDHDTCIRHIANLQRRNDALQARLDAVVNENARLVMRA